MVSSKSPDYHAEARFSRGGRSVSAGVWRDLSRKREVRARRRMLGRRLSPATRAKISQACTGRKLSAETRAKMSRARRARRGQRSPRYRHGAYATPTGPVETLADVIADLSAKQAQLSALLDRALESGGALDSGGAPSPSVLTLFALHAQAAAKLRQLLRYQQSQASTAADQELAAAINQALDELAREFGWKV